MGDSTPNGARMLEVYTEDLAYGGLAVGRIEGKVVLVRGALHGERVRALVRRKKRSYIIAQALDVLEPSPHRVRPPCPHQALCGGCPLMILEPGEQTRIKQRQVIELLRRIGKVDPPEPEEPWRGERIYRYRNKMEFTFSRRPWVEKSWLDSGRPLPEGPALGLHPPGVYQAVFDIVDCWLQSATANKLLEETRSFARTHRLEAYDSHSDTGLLRHLVVRESGTTGEILVVLVTRREDEVLGHLARRLIEGFPSVVGVVNAVNLRKATVAVGDYEKALAGREFITERIAGFTYRLGASTFFQTRSDGAEALVEGVLEYGFPSAGERALDLYCGVGTFSLPMAARGVRVTGIESGRQAVEAASSNAEKNELSGLEFHASQVEAADAWPWWEKRWDLVVLDPPRSGMHPRAASRLAHIRAGRIVYVSCNPATLARDIGILSEEGGWEIRRLRMYDIFPHTPHMETIVRLERKS